jgi:hypothetical protein
MIKRTVTSSRLSALSAKVTVGEREFLAISRCVLDIARSEAQAESAF